MEYGLRLSVLALTLYASAHGVVFSTVDQTLSRLFPKATRSSDKHLYLSEEDMKAFGSKEGLITYYVVRDGNDIYTAYVDTHTVRTLAESILIVLTAEAKVYHLEILAFSEPQDYMASPEWIKQFHQKSLKDVPDFKGSIRSMTGATLTSDALTKATARVLRLNSMKDRHRKKS